DTYTLSLHDALPILRRRVSPEVRLLAVGSAAGLAAIDVVYVARRRISLIYLLDALGEVILIGAWVAAMRTDRRGRGRGVRRQLRSEEHTSELQSREK